MNRAMTVLWIAALATAYAPPSAAQDFVLTQNYDSYRPSSGLPSVGLPRQETMGYQLVKPQTEPAGALPAPSQTASQDRDDQQRRTDAGAIRKAQNSAARQPSATTPAPASQLPSGQQTKYPEGTVIRGEASVYDGQNLVVDGAPVRLDGAEAPGLAQKCLTSRALVWACGVKAAEKLRDLVSGRTVTCVVTEPLGQGAAAICSVTGIADLGRNMISEGLAVSNGHDHGRYFSTQAQAKGFRRGIWIGSFEAPWKWRAINGQ
jgi:endonuclease YncB( thermonuclease family)